MNVCFDYDGVISANFAHYSQLAYDFIRSGHQVYVMTGANRIRADVIEETLEAIRFPCMQVIKRPKDFISTPKNIGIYKKQYLIDYKIDLWFDNDIKQYEQAGVDFSDVKTAIVRI